MSLAYIPKKWSSLPL